VRSVWPESFTLSAILHALLVGLFVVYALFLAPKPQAQPQVFELVAPPPLGDPDAASPQPVTEDGAEDAADPIEFTRPRVPLNYRPLPPAPQPVVENPPPDAITRQVPRQQQPAQRPQPTTPRPQPQEQRPSTMTYEEFQRSQNRRTSTPAASQVRAPRLDAPSTTPGSRTGVAGGTNVSASDIDSYLARLVAALKAAWQRPEGLPPGLSCQVMFDISETGVISGARILRSSGNSQFDQSVLAVFQRMRTFAPPPGRQALNGNRQVFELSGE
jgi:TonB family protein